ncbi:MAG: hypothetical protein PHT60_04820 [Acidiphilium sp.]|nr:hypothetical protein [Acidiphilium sp.]MDD4935085.1 hypothetical protein [Acidiphilium sp.]
MTAHTLKPARRTASLLAIAIGLTPALPAAVGALNPVGISYAATPQNPCAPAPTTAKHQTQKSAKTMKKTAKKPVNPCAP